MRTLKVGCVLVVVWAAGCADAPDELEPLAPAGEPALQGEVVRLGVTCPPSLERYPVAGPHNGGWDPNALTYTCPPHPGHAPDGSDFLAGDHYGNDIFAAAGTPMVAPRTGTIASATHTSVGGNVVKIVDACGWHYYHAHLEAIHPSIFVGKSVQAGDIIGWVGNTGNAVGTSPHLHFSIHPGVYNQGIDPFPLLQAVDGTACGGGCTPHCEGSVIVGADCSQGDCGAFGATCAMQNGQPTCIEPCVPHCAGSVMVATDCSQGDCGAFGASCAMEGGVPTCVLACDPHCEGSVGVHADCSQGDCGVFGLQCVVAGGAPTCVASCAPHCEGTVAIGADCEGGDCGAFGAACIMEGGQPTCAAPCTPRCEGSVMVHADCSQGDCGAFGGGCAMGAAGPECVFPCVPHCEGNDKIDALCGRTSCASGGVGTCGYDGASPQCVGGCKAHCEGNVVVDDQCGQGDCGAFGVTCVQLGEGPSCAEASPCTPHCQGSEIVYGDCSVGDCGAFGLTCVDYLGFPECDIEACVPHCEGTVLVDGGCNEGDCGVFAAYCSTAGGSEPHCASAFCVDSPDAVGVSHDVCLPDGSRAHCDAAGGLSPKPCPEGLACNACGGCGDLAETCNYLDDDCDGEVDEGATNACGGCGVVPEEVCNYLDDDCDGVVDDGVRNACDACGAVPVEVCDNVDNDCDGETDEGFGGLGASCSDGEGVCEVPGIVVCAAVGTETTCSAAAGAGTEEVCNGLDDDCDGEVDEGFGLGDTCPAGEGLCQVAGIVGCDPHGAARCVATAVACDDGDPCTADTCDPLTGDCASADVALCCALGALCPAGWQCVDGACVDVQCAPCEVDGHCEAPGAACIDYADGGRCGTVCDAETGCPQGFTCVPLDANPAREICLADSACSCGGPEPACVGSDLVLISGCGLLGPVLEACAHGCEAGACLPASADLQPEPQPEPEPDATNSEDVASTPDAEQGPEPEDDLPNPPTPDPAPVETAVGPNPSGSDGGTTVQVQLDDSGCTTGNSRHRWPLVALTLVLLALAGASRQRRRRKV